MEMSQQYERLQSYAFFPPKSTIDDKNGTPQRSVGALKAKVRDRMDPCADVFVQLKMCDHMDCTYYQHTDC